MSGPDAMHTAMHTAIRTVLGVAVRSTAPLSGGCVAEVVAVELDDGTQLVAKLDPDGGAGLEVEAAMLADLRAAGAPVPRVLHSSPDLLLMEHVPGRAGAQGEAEEALADVLASLHAVSAGCYGYGYDTRIGGLVQPNAWSDAWVPFFAERRLLHRALAARAAGRLPARLCRDIETLAGRLDRLLVEPARPALLHGDLWSGNVLSAGGRVTALLDPALHFGHPEVELAFTTLFGSFGQRFQARYRERTGGPDPAFWSERCTIYHLYPLLVHVELFGGSYVDDVARILARHL